MPSTTPAQRLRAARVLADLTVEQLADTIAMRGLGAKTLGAIEREEREMRPHEAQLIARATGVPEWFLAAGFDDVQDPAEPSLAERVEALENRMDSIYEIALNRIGAEIGATPRPDEGSATGHTEDRPR